MLVDCSTPHLPCTSQEVVLSPPVSPCRAAARMRSFCSDFLQSYGSLCRNAVQDRAIPVISGGWELCWFLDSANSLQTGSVSCKSLGLGMKEGAVVGYCDLSRHSSQQDVEFMLLVQDGDAGRLVHQQECQREQPTAFFTAP